MNKKGFTLIELLAVIIILGILMIIAIPSVTTYINDSRKEAYVDTAKEIVSGTRNIVNEGKLGMYDTNTTYYIPVDYIKTENASKSPYGEFTQAYVGVVYDGKGYKYYWISVDDTGQGVNEVTIIDELDVDDIKSDLSATDIKETVETTGIGSRRNILILHDGQWGAPREASNHAGGDTGTVIYPTGKTKETVVRGDIVKIGTEEFYVVKHSGNDLVLLAKYNLKVGNVYRYTKNGNSFSAWTKEKEYSSSDSGFGMQDSEIKGEYDVDPNYNGIVYILGTIPFAEDNYWMSVDTPADVYGNGCKFKPYIDNYASTLDVSVKEARLLNKNEIEELGCSFSAYSCSGAPSWVYSSSYWISTANDGIIIWGVSSRNYLTNYDFYEDGSFGVRPVIVI